MFLSCFIAGFKYLHCLFKNTRHIFDTKNVVFAMFFTSFSLLIEPRGKRNEILMFILPK